MSFQDKSFVGTGFLTSGFRFVTAAHNILDLHEGAGWADKVKLYFGFNETANLQSKTCIELNGNDFTIPPNHRKATDEYDFAWCDLKAHWNKLPSQYFTIDECLSLSSTPNYAICGEYIEKCWHSSMNWILHSCTCIQTIER